MNVVRFHSARTKLTREQALRAAQRLFSTPIEERAQKIREFSLEDPELILTSSEELHSRLETDPSFVSDEAEYLYHFLSTPERPIGSFDERDYFLGELALIAGTACRLLFRKEECRRWLDRSEGHFIFTINSSAHVARIAYQRLGLAAEERRFEEVLELAPIWARNFSRLGLSEDALKCNFLDANALRETGRVAEAIEVMTKTLDAAREQGLTRLEAIAATNLVAYHRASGNPGVAMGYAESALPLLVRLKNRVNIAKLRWMMGDLLRDQSKLADAIETYRAALAEAEELGLRGDVAAIHLVLADTLLDAGQEAQAEWEIRAALPIIDEEQMVPEGIAALALLKESIRRRRIDRQALRKLHGYFNE